MKRFTSNECNFNNNFQIYRIIKMFHSLNRQVKQAVIDIVKSSRFNSEISTLDSFMVTNSGINRQKISRFCRITKLELNCLYVKRNLPIINNPDCYIFPIKIIYKMIRELKVIRSFTNLYLASFPRIRERFYKSDYSNNKRYNRNNIWQVFIPFHKHYFTRTISELSCGGSHG